MPGGTLDLADFKEIEKLRRWIEYYGVSVVSGVNDGFSPLQWSGIPYLLDRPRVERGEELDPRDRPQHVEGLQPLAQPFAGGERERYGRTRVLCARSGRIEAQLFSKDGRHLTNEQQAPRPVEAAVVALIQHDHKWYGGNTWAAQG